MYQTYFLIVYLCTIFVSLADLLTCCTVKVLIVRGLVAFTSSILDPFSLGPCIKCIVSCTALIIVLLPSNCIAIMDSKAVDR